MKKEEAKKHFKAGKIQIYYDVENCDLLNWITDKDYNGILGWFYKSGDSENKSFNLPSVFISEIEEGILDHITESVNHPNHYGGENNTYEAIKVIEAHNLNFNKGNAIKYTLRAGIKNADKEIEDIEKAIWYLQREILKLKAND